jgi:four helix bundle protein
MSSYQLSKAWHHGHRLAIAVHQLSWQLPKNDEFKLALNLRRASAIAPTKLQESLEQSTTHDKLRSYEAARRAVIEVQEHLSLARDLHYIDEQLFRILARQAIVAQRTLTEMIQAIKKENYGIEHN